MGYSAALVIYSGPKRPHIVASTMSKRCVAAGCDKGSDGQFSLRAQWSRETLGGEKHFKTSFLKYKQVDMQCGK